MPKYPSWPSTNQGNIVGTRLANELYHRFTGDLNILSLTDQRDAALAELLATTPEVFNVKSFGAVGDGVTDDVAAIQAAIDAATINGDVVFFPVGTYLFKSQINLKTNVTLLGASVYKSILLADPTMVNIVKISYSGDNVAVCNMKWDGNEPNMTGSTNTAGSFLSFDNAGHTGLIVDNIWGIMSDSSFIGTHSTDKIRITNVRFEGWQDHAIYLGSNIVDALVSNFYCKGDAVLTGQQVLKVRGSSKNVRFINGYVEAFNSMVSLTSEVGQSLESTDIVFENITFKGAVGSHVLIARSAANDVTMDKVSFININAENTGTGNIAFRTTSVDADFVTIDDLRIIGGSYKGFKSLGGFLKGDTGAALSKRLEVSGISFDQLAGSTVNTEITGYKYVYIKNNIFDRDPADSGAANLDLFKKCTNFTRMVISDNIFKDYDIIFVDTVGDSLDAGSVIFANNDCNGGRNIASFSAAGSPVGTFDEVGSTGDMAGKYSTVVVSFESQIRVSRDITVNQVVTLENAATPPVFEGSSFKTGGTTTITDFDGGHIGKTIKILSAHAITITDGTNILLNGSTNFVMAAGDVLVLTMYNDQVWVEDSRQVN